MSDVSLNKIDSYFMKRAVALAKKATGKTSPNPVVGAIIVKDGVIIGEGYHKKCGENHAEINAINSALKKSLNEANQINGCTIYVTLEPCSTFGRTPPCVNSIIEHKISRVVIGNFDPNPLHAGKAVSILKSHGITVSVEVEKELCFELNEAFYKWIVARRPFLLLKMGMTLDGKIAASDGESKWITGEKARKRVQNLRKWADAIMVGGKTFAVDGPSLTVRNSKNELLRSWKQPLKIICSSKITKDELKSFYKDDNFYLINANNIYDWNTHLQKLGNMNITSILVEGGGRLADELLHYGLVDKIEFHIAPKLLGCFNSIPSVGGFTHRALSHMIDVNRVKIKKYGNDICITGYPKIKEKALGCISLNNDLT